MAYTLYVNSSGKLVTSDGNAVLPAQDRPELTAGVVYDFDIIPVAGAVAGTYTLSGDIKFDRRALMMQGVTSTVADNVIQFRGVSTDTAAFWDKPKSAGERLYLRMTLADSGSSISILEDHIFCRPGIAGDDTTPPPANPGSVTSLNGLPGNVVIKTAAGEALAAADGVVTLPEIEPGTSINGLTGVVVLVDSSGEPLAVDENTIVIPGGDVTLAGDNAFLGANSFAQPLTVAGRTVSGLYPDRNPVAQIPVLDATLGVCHYLDATFTEIDLSYPVWHLVEIRALACSVDPAITGTVEITPYVDGVAQNPVTINVGATWAAVTIPLAVETGSIRLVRTGGTLADGSWVTAAFRGITAMVTI